MAVEDDGSVVLAVQGVGFAYAGQAPLLCDWSAAIDAGVTLIHGDTGTGKSTLLQVLAGELLSTGRLTLRGVTLNEDRAGYRRQVFLSDPSADTFEPVTALACTASLSDGDAGFDVAEWQSLVDGFALTPHLDKALYMLSTGSKRKVWLASALASGRALVLLDEPASALDGPSIRCLRLALARRALRRDSALVVASAEPLDGIALAGLIELPLR